jgi:Uncharacterized protein conserved in bacteria
MRGSVLNRLPGRISLAVLLAAGFSSVALAGTVTVTVTGVRNNQGVVRCGLYSSPDGFRVPGKETRQAIGQISQGRSQCSFGDVPPGTYAVALFHAEHNETALQTGLFGRPKQGVGFSNNPSISFGPPSFKDAAFTVGSKPVNLQIQMKY